MSNPKHLNVYLLTFNCGRELLNPEAFASHLFDAIPDCNKSSQTTVQQGINSKSTPSSEPPALIVLNLQEVAPIAYAFLGGSFVTPYLDRFQKAVDLAVAQQFGKNRLQDETEDEKVEYSRIYAETAGLTAIMVFVRSDLIGHVSRLAAGSVGVGVQEMGNKGAIGAKISWKLDTRDSCDDEAEHDGERAEYPFMNMTFVSAHLAPMETELERRNKDYKDIVRGLVFIPIKAANDSNKQSDLNTITDETDEDAPLLQGLSNTETDNNTSKKGMYDATSHLFFAGDLNYRTSITPPEKSPSSTKTFFPKPVPNQSDPSHYLQLLPQDQLTTALHKNQTLHGLTESKITFPPTYKYKFPPSTTTPSSQIHLLTESNFQSLNNYPFASHRYPSWCDRILYSQSLSSTSSKITPLGPYTALPLFRTSDHRPVAIYLSIPLESINNIEFEKKQPVPVDWEGWKAKRDMARRKEIVVGVLAYLGLTWEGRIMFVAGVLGLVGVSLVLRGLLGGE